MADAECPLCDDGSTFQVVGDVKPREYACSFCGKFAFDPAATTELRQLKHLTPVERRQLRFAIRSKTERGGVQMLSPLIIDEIRTEEKAPDVEAILGLARNEIVNASRESPFSSIKFDLSRFPLFWVDSRQALANVLTMLESAGTIHINKREGDTVALFALPDALKPSA